nr:nitric oxide synthase oxygenase [Kibdelosporangium sp. MJ126-NF4]CEL15788.1 Nitric oxide synthase oxygenase [Kibdelosporangium sp. MJ126-NF4]
MTALYNETITGGPVAFAAAEDFLRMFHDAHPEAGAVRHRLAEVRAEIAETGTYRHTNEELCYGARVALRDSGWCTSGLPWRRLKVRDLRGIHKAQAVAAQCFEHLRLATTGGKIQPLVTVFAPDRPDAPGPRIWNAQLVSYAGYPAMGDARNADFTESVEALGWQPPVPRTAFDHLPLVVSTGLQDPQPYRIPREIVNEVPLTHPDLPWFAELGLRWPAVPVITNMRLCIGGIDYPAAPFNTWFVGTDIGTRSLADESAYAMLRPVADRLGLDTSTDRTLWRDRATLELNRAVLHSFDTARVMITDHYAETQHRLAWLRSRRNRGERPTFRPQRSR